MEVISETLGDAHQNGVAHKVVMLLIEWCGSLRILQLQIHIQEDGGSHEFIEPR